MDIDEEKMKRKNDEEEIDESWILKEKEDPKIKVSFGTMLLGRLLFGKFHE